MPTLEDVRFNALRNALYHTSRRRKLELLDRVGSFLVILLSAGAATELAANTSPLAPKLLAVITASIGALQLVFGFGSRARDHEFLQRRYYDLLAEIEEFGADENRIPGWCATLSRISGDEPPNRLLPEAQAYNAAASALGRSAGHHLYIPIWLMLFGHFLAFDGWRLDTNDERKSR